MINTFQPEDRAPAAIIARVASCSPELVEHVAERLGYRGAWLPALAIVEELRRIERRRHNRIRRRNLRRKLAQAAHGAAATA